MEHFRDLFFTTGCSAALAAARAVSGVSKRLVKAPKLHFVDTGLACALLGLYSLGVVVSGAAPATVAAARPHANRAMSVATADHQHRLRVRMSEQRRVRHALVIEELVPLGGLEHVVQAQHAPEHRGVEHFHLLEGGAR